MSTQIISFKTRKGVEVVQLSEIIFCIAHGPYTTIVTPDRQLTITKSLNQTEKICHCKHFFRSHKSFLVNTRFILKIHNNLIMFRNYPDCCPISRRKLPESYIALNISNIKTVL